MADTSNTPPESAVEDIMHTMWYIDSSQQGLHYMYNYIYSLCLSFSVDNGNTKPGTLLDRPFKELQNALSNELDQGYNIDV